MVIEQGSGESVRVRSDERASNIEEIAVRAYQHSLVELKSLAGTEDDDLAYIGDVDARASDPRDEVRFAVAGRLIAAAEALGGRGG